jgi:hypothetical protein
MLWQYASKPENQVVNKKPRSSTSPGDGNGQASGRVMHNGALGLQRSAHLFLENIHILTTDGSHHLDAIEAAEGSIPTLGHRSVAHDVGTDPPFETFLPHPFLGELSLGN